MSLGNPLIPPAPTVAELLDNQAATLATALHLGVSRPVVGVEFYDATGASTGGEGVLWLVPSWRNFDAPARSDLLQHAERSSVAGIVIQGGSLQEISTAFGSLESTSVAIVALAEHVSWREFEAVIELSISENTPSITASVLQPDYLFAIADSIAEVFGGSVAVENYARTLLAYSTLPNQVIDETRIQGIHTRRVPKAARNHEQYRALQLSSEPIRFPEFDGHELPRAAINVSAGSLQLGSIWAIDPSGEDVNAPLPQAKRDALVMGAQAAAAHLLATWRITDADVRRRDEALGRMLNGETTSDDLAALAIGPNAVMQVTAFRFVSETPGPGDVKQLEAFVERQLRARVRETAATLIRDTCFVAVSGSSEPATQDALLATVRAAGRSFAQPIRASMARPCLAGDSLRAACIELEALLKLSYDPSRPVIKSADVRARLIASHVAGLFEAHPYLQHPAVAGKTDRRAKEYRETLLAWFECGSVSAAAAHLGVHENTVRYRIAQATEQWGVHLDEPDESFALWASLIAWRHRVC